MVFFLTRRSPPLPSGRVPRSSLMSEPGEHQKRSPAQHQNTKAKPRHTLLDACLTPPDISQTKQGHRSLVAPDARQAARRLAEARLSQWLSLLADLPWDPHLMVALHILHAAAPRSESPEVKGTYGQAKGCPHAGLAGCVR